MQFGPPKRETFNTKCKVQYIWLYKFLFLLCVGKMTLIAAGDTVRSCQPMKCKIDRQIDDLVDFFAREGAEATKCVFWCFMLSTKATKRL